MRDALWMHVPALVALTLTCCSKADEAAPAPATAASSAAPTAAPTARPGDDAPATGAPPLSPEGSSPASRPGPMLPSPSVELGAVALPDTKSCVRDCTAKSQVRSGSAKSMQAECLRDCTATCMKHCTQKQSGIPDFETKCQKDCEAEAQRSLAR